MIEDKRGAVGILSRKKLEKLTCECHAVIQQLSGESDLKGASKSGRFLSTAFPRPKYTACRMGSFKVERYAIDVAMRLESIAAKGRK